MERTPGITYDEMIENMAFAHMDGIGAAPGYISDKTAYIALHYRQKAADVNRDSASDLVEQLMNLEDKCGRLDILIPILEGGQREVIRLRYIEGLKRLEVCEKIGFAPRTYDK